MEPWALPSNRPVASTEPMPGLLLVQIGVTVWVVPFDKVAVAE